MPNDNSRFAQAGQSISQGLNTLGEGIKGMDPTKIREDALMRQNQLKMQELQLQQHQAQVYETQQAVANKGINDTILQGLQLDDPKAFDAFMNDRQGQLNQFYQMKGQVLSPSTFEVLKTSSQDYKAARTNLNMLYNKVLSNRYANKYSPIDVTPDQLTKLRNDLSKGPTELYSQDTKTLKDIEDLAQEQAKAQFNRNTALMSEAAKAKAVDAKTAQTDEKLVNTTIDTVEGLTRVGAQGPLQMANKRSSLARDGLRLVDQIQSGKVKGNRSVEIELARNIDGLVSVNQGSAELVKDMVNKTIYSKYASVAEWLSSSPKNHIPPQFLDNYKEQMKGQLDFWQSERAKVLDAQAEKLQGAFERNPALKNRWDKSLKKFVPDYAPAGQDKGSPNVDKVLSGLKF